MTKITQEAAIILLGLIEKMTAADGTIVTDETLIDNSILIKHHGEVSTPFGIAHRIDVTDKKTNTVAGFLCVFRLNKVTAPHNFTAYPYLLNNPPKIERPNIVYIEDDNAIHYNPQQQKDAAAFALLWLRQLKWDHKLETFQFSS